MSKIYLSKGYSRMIAVTNIDYNNCIAAGIVSSERKILYTMDTEWVLSSCFENTNRRLFRKIEELQ